MAAVLEVRDLRVCRQGRPVLNGINLSLREGEAAVLSGSNGCGKTTLLRTIAGLLEIGEGSVSIQDMDLLSSEWKRNRYVLAYVAQEQEHRDFPVTVTEMVSTGLAAQKLSASRRHARVARALEDTGISSLKDRYYFSLSGGERQRVALARCLCQGAGLLLLDEPLTYLDKGGRRDFSLLLEKVRKEYRITILLVTHTDDELSEVNWRRLGMNGGVLESGS